jgi:uncharacterized protein YegL
MSPPGRPKGELQARAREGNPTGAPPARLAAAAAVMALALAGCDQPPPPKPKAAAPPPAAAKSLAPPPPAAPPLAQSAPKGPPSARPLTPAWPPAGAGEARETAISRDLFARNYYVVLDASGSMNGTGCSRGALKVVAAREALEAFAAALPADANLGLQVFDSKGVRERLPLATKNRDEFRAELAKVVAGGATPLLESVTQAYRKLIAQAAKQLGYGEYHLVIVTDGEASQGQDPTPAVNRLLAESPVVVHTIGFCIGTKHSLNQPGRTLYRPADDPGELRRELAAVLAEAPSFAVLEFR